MEHLILHPASKTHVAQFIDQPSHALLLVGSNGMGKTALAETIIAEVLDVTLKRLAAHPYVMTLRPADNGSISIDAIRDLQHFLQLKTLGEKLWRRAILVEHAEGLTTEAQNAYLKLLEEPPADTLMILTADSQRALLPTILSRTQVITLAAPDKEDLKRYFAARPDGQDQTAINQAFFLSGGLPGLMNALLAKDQSHPLITAVATAKEILQKQVLERLALVEGLSKQREDAKYTLAALQHIAQTGLDQAAKQGNPTKIKQWHHILKTATTASDALAKNANTKLVLNNLMLNI